MLPIGDDNSSRRTVPLVAYALIVLNVLFFLVEMSGGDAFARYGAIRVTHVGQDFLILDWAYQTDPGNPELVVGGGIRAARPTGVTIAH